MLRRYQSKHQYSSCTTNAVRRYYSRALPWRTAAGNEENNGQDQTYHEQDPSNIYRSPRYSRKPQDARD